jgi:hypothetical protein
MMLVAECGADAYIAGLTLLCCLTWQGACQWLYLHECHQRVPSSNILTAPPCVASWQITHLGFFTNEVDAARAFDAAVLSLPDIGRRTLNFPQVRATCPLP